MKTIRRNNINYEPVRKQGLGPMNMFHHMRTYPTVDDRDVVRPNFDTLYSIMIASAAIPAAFPPTMINVEANGRPYQEMHVDGGTMAQLFLYPPSLHVKEISKAHRVARERRAYIIRNARLDPRWAEVDRRTMSIAERAISSMIATQGIVDLYLVSATPAAVLGLSGAVLAETDADATAKTDAVLDDSKAMIQGD